MNLQPLGWENNDVRTAHTIDVDLLSPGGWVLDVGARGFEFALDCATMGYNVLSLDPSKDVVDPHIPGVVFVRAALGPESGVCLFYEEGDGSGSHLVGHGQPASYTVQVYSLIDLMADYNIELFEAIKLDCEGAEYDILAQLPIRVVAKQINAAFHAFAFPDSDARQQAAEKTLFQMYKPVQHEASIRHGHSIPCYWDSLFVLKSIEGYH